MIAVRVTTTTDAARLVEALLVAGGAVPAPADPADRDAYLQLARDLGDALDALPVPPAPPTF